VSCEPNPELDAKWNAIVKRTVGFLSSEFRNDFESCVLISGYDLEATMYALHQFVHKLKDEKDFDKIALILTSMIKVGFSMGFEASKNLQKPAD
jgi:hypothetical protein